MAKTPNNYKHINRITANNDYRPLLQGIRYENGNISATDGYRLLVLRDKLPKDIDLTMHPKSLDLIEGNYPDVERLIPEKPISKGTLKHWQVLTMKQMLMGIPSNNLAPMKIHVGKKMKLELENGISCEINLTHFEGEEYTILAQPIYVKHALEFVLDQRVDDTTIVFDSVLKPFMLTREKEFDYLITPIRPGK